MGLGVSRSIEGRRDCYTPTLVVVYIPIEHPTVVRPPRSDDHPWSVTAGWWWWHDNRVGSPMCKKICPAHLTLPEMHLSATPHFVLREVKHKVQTLPIVRLKIISKILGLQLWPYQGNSF